MSIALTFTVPRAGRGLSELLPPPSVRRLTFLIPTFELYSRSTAWTITFLSWGKPAKARLIQSSAISVTGAISASPWAANSRYRIGRYPRKLRFVWKLTWSVFNVLAKFCTSWGRGNNVSYFPCRDCPLTFFKGFAKNSISFLALQPHLTPSSSQPLQGFQARSFTCKR